MDEYVPFDLRTYSRTDCPHCRAELDPLPKSKKRCPSCHESIYVRSGTDGRRHLLRETDLAAFQATWDERNFYEMLCDESPYLERARSQLMADLGQAWRDLSNPERFRMIAALAIARATEDDEMYSLADIHIAFAAFLTELGEPPLPSLRAAARAQLQWLSDYDLVEVLACDCRTCAKDNLRRLKHRDQVRDQLIPHENCEYDACTCSYQAPSGGDE